MISTHFQHGILGCIGLLVLPSAILALPFGSGWIDLPSDQPLERVADAMQVATMRLSRQLTDRETQQSQLQAMQQLDTLINVLEQVCQQGQSSPSQSGPSQPLDRSQVAGGPGGDVMTREPNDANDNAWAQLPPRQREQILQSLAEGFPPHYRATLERYYRGLADEASPTDDAPSRSPPPEANSPDRLDRGQ